MAAKLRRMLRRGIRGDFGDLHPVVVPAAVHIILSGDLPQIASQAEGGQDTRPRPFRPQGDGLRERAHRPGGYASPQSRRYGTCQWLRVAHCQWREGKVGQEPQGVGGVGFVESGWRALAAR